MQWKKNWRIHCDFHFKILVLNSINHRKIREKKGKFMNVGRLNVSKKIFPLTVYSINFPNLPYKYIYIIINYNKS